jgi:hypothetical protein
VSKIEPPVGDPFMDACDTTTVLAFLCSGVPFSIFESLLYAFASAFSSVRKNRGFSIFSPFDNLDPDWTDEPVLADAQAAPEQATSFNRR